MVNHPFHKVAVLKAAPLPKGAALFLSSSPPRRHSARKVSETKPPSPERSEPGDDCRLWQGNHPQNETCHWRSARRKPLRPARQEMAAGR